MDGESDLGKLLAHMEPRLHADEFVFCTAAEPKGDAVCVFREAEGYSLILPRAEAQRQGMRFTYPCRMITLTVHSSLSAVGLLARVTALLAGRGISVNAVSGFYHDHLFVPADRAEEAMAVLQRASREAGPSAP